MFDNPIQTATPMAQFVPPPERSKAPEMALQAVSQGIDLFKSAKEAEAQQLAAKMTIDVEDSALRQIEQYRFMSDSVGARKARSLLEKQYRDTLMDIRSPELRDVYTDRMKGVLGYVPSAQVDEQAIETEKRVQQDRDQRLLAGAAYLNGMGLDVNSYSEEERIRQADRIQAAATRKAYLDNQLAIDQGTRDIEVSKGLNGVEIESNLMFDTILEGVRKAATSGTAQFQTTQQQVLAQLTQYKAALRPRVAELGAQFGLSPRDIPNDVYQSQQAKVDALINLVSGSDAQKLSETQFKLMGTDAFKQLLDTGNKYATLVAMSSSMGLPIPEFTTTAIADASRLPARNTAQEQFMYPVAVAKAPPSVASDMADQPISRVWSDLVNTFKSSVKGLVPEAAQMEGGVALRALTDAGMNSKNWAKGGALTLHKALAEDQKLADELAPKILAEASARGVSPEQVWAGNLNEFSKTLVKSLKTVAPVGEDVTLFGLMPVGKTGSAVVNISADGKRVRFTLDESKMPRGVVNTSGAFASMSPATPDLFVQYDQAPKFRAAVKQAERELNTVLLSYEKVTGEDPTPLVERYVQDLQRLLQLYSQ